MATSPFSSLRWERFRWFEATRQHGVVSDGCCIALQGGTGLVLSIREAGGAGESLQLLDEHLQLIGEIQTGHTRLLQLSQAVRLGGKLKAKANKQHKHLTQPPRTLIDEEPLVTIGIELQHDGTSTTTVRRWEPPTAAGAAWRCTLHKRIFPPGGGDHGLVAARDPVSPEPLVTAVAVACGGALIAVGCSDASVWLLRANDSGEQHSLFDGSSGFLRLGNVPPPSIALRAAGTEFGPITALHFGGFEDGGSSADSGDDHGVDAQESNATTARSARSQGSFPVPPTLFVITAQLVMSVTICNQSCRFEGGSCALTSSEASAAIDASPCRVLFHGGSGSQGDEGYNMCSCVKMTRDLMPTELAVGRAEAVYFYAADDPSRAFAFSGFKRAMGWHRGHLVVITADRGRDCWESNSKMMGDEMHSIQVYDLQAKCVAFHSSLDAPFVGLHCGPRAVFVRLGDGSVLSLQEASLQAKLEMLYARGNFAAALVLANAQKTNALIIGEVHARCAEHMLLAGNAEASVEHWIATIGAVPPSAVIVKLLAPHCAPILIQYLRALIHHPSVSSTKEHSALLLACLIRDATCARGRKINNIEGAKSDPHDHDDEPASVGMGHGLAMQARACGGKPGNASLKGEEGLESHPETRARRADAGEEGSNRFLHLREGDASLVAFVEELCHGAESSLDVACVMPDLDQNSLATNAFGSTSACSCGSDSVDDEARRGDKNHKMDESGAGPSAPRSYSVMPPFPIDIEAAILTLRSSGFTTLALRLSQCFSCSKQILCILIDDMRDLDAALRIIDDLPPCQAASGLLSHGRKLLTARAPETVEVLLKHVRPSVRTLSNMDLGPVASAEPSGERLDVTAAVGLFERHQTWLVHFLERLLACEGFPIQDILLTLLDLYLGLAEMDSAGMLHMFAGGACDCSCSTQAVELEGLTAASSESSAKPALATATAARSPTLNCALLSRGEYHARALQLLRRLPPSEDVRSQALQICAAYSFVPGSEAILREQERPAALLELQAETQQHEAMLATCIAHGSQHPQLWVHALRHAAQMDEHNGRGLLANGCSESSPRDAAFRLGGDCEKLLSASMGIVERDSLLSPLALLSTLEAGHISARLEREGVNDMDRRPCGMTLRTVASYFERKLASDAAVAAEAEADAARYEAESRRFESEALSLSFGTHTFRQTSCISCSADLSHPAVYFYCGHAYHTKCLAGPGLGDSHQTNLSYAKAYTSRNPFDVDVAEGQDGEHQCPTCAQQLRRSREHHTMVRARAAAHDEFYRTLAEAEDRFGALSDFFSKGVLAPLADQHAKVAQDTVVGARASC